MQRTYVSLIALAALVLAAFAGGPAAAQSTKPWRHGLIEPKSDAGILMMAAERGFFKKMGLDVEIVPVKDDQILLKAVIAGDLDSFEGGPTGAMIAAAHGADVKIMGCTWLTVPHGIFVHDDITAMDQLKGKTMAISSPGAFPDIFAKGALAHFNMPADAMNYASLGGDLDRYKALVAHVVGRRRGVGRIRADRRQGAHQDAGVGERCAAEIPAHVSDHERGDAQGAAARCRQVPRRRNARSALCRRP